MRARHHATSFLGILAAAFAATVATTSSAMPTSVMAIGGGNEGRLDGDMRERGPGFEQTSMVNVVQNGTSYIVLITMQSVTDGNSPWQCSCASYQLNTNGPPTEVTKMTRLTNLSGERACNHPKAAVGGDGNIVWMFGSDDNSNRPNTYAGAIDAQCRQLVAPQIVSLTDNQNDGAPDIAFNGTDGTGAQIFTGAYLSTGGDNDITYALGLSLTKQDLVYSLTKTWIQPIITPANIGRPALATGGLDRTLLCASEGHNRPPEGGIDCAWLNSHDGSTVWKNQISASDPQNMKYMSQPSLARLSDGHYVLNHIESNGGGKNTNLKGSNLAHLISLDVVSDAIVKGGEITGAATYQTHSAVCAGAYGTSGNPVAAVISASPTGIGRPAMLMVGYDDGAKQFSYDQVNDNWPIAWYGDSGHLANWYGRNPGRQGRDFLRCIGDVANPGHGVQGGYMSNVASFFVAAVAGRVPGDAKNSLTLSLVPGQVDVQTAPENPQPADQVNTTPPAAPVAPTTSGDASSSKGCACDAAGRGDSRGAGGLSLVAMAIGLAFARRRRPARTTRGQA
jgi:hypothetical protein